VLTDTSAGTIAAVTAAVAEHVRALRRARGWSLDELSGRSGVSKGMVVQIEAARTNPSVGTLCRIADAFGVTVGRLLEPGVERTVRITTAAGAPVLWQGGYGGFGRLLGSVTDPACVELWEWRLAPGDRYPASDPPAGTRQLLHALSGTVIVTAHGDEYEVHAGQTMELSTDRAHAYRNDGPALTRYLVALVLPARPEPAAQVR
jgi:transcriptional regulator with XRE-family HTH domain